MRPGQHHHLIHQILEKLSKIKANCLVLKTKFGKLDACNIQHSQEIRKEDFSETDSQLLQLPQLIRGIA